MERKSIWKNFLLLTIGGLLALHINVSNAADSTETSSTSSDVSDNCVLEQE
jgi:hypothetical protein